MKDLKIVSKLGVIPHDEVKKLFITEAEKLSRMEITENNLALAKGAGTTLNKAKQAVVDFYKEKKVPLKAELDKITAEEKELIKIFEDNREIIKSSLRVFEDRRLKSAGEAVYQAYLNTIGGIKELHDIDVSFNYQEFVKLGAVNFKKDDIFEVSSVKKDTLDSLQNKANAMMLEAKTALMEEQRRKAEQDARDEKIRQEAIMQEKERQAQRDREELERLKHQKEEELKSIEKEPTVKPKRATGDNMQTEFTICIKVKTKKPSKTDDVLNWAKKELSKTALKGAELEIR